MPIVLNVNTYKSKRHFFNTVFPNCEKATDNEINFYMYHNVHEYHDKKKHITERNIENKGIIRCANTLSTTCIQMQVNLQFQ